MLNSIFLGFLFLSYGNGVVVWALRYVDSGFAALVIATQPLVVLLMMFVLQGKKIQLMSIFGVILGITGVTLLISQETIVTNENTLLGILMIFSAMLAWSYASIFVKQICRTPNNINSYKS